MLFNYSFILKLAKVAGQKVFVSKSFHDFDVYVYVVVELCRKIATKENVNLRRIKY